MCLLRNRAQMMSKCDENKKVAYKGHLIVSDALTTAEIDPQQYEIYFFQDNKAKKKKVNGEVIYRYTKTVSFSTHG